MDESLGQSHTNTLMPCEEDGEAGKCRVSVHYEGEGDKNGVDAKTEVL